jgi:hypothetical protein
MLGYAENLVEHPGEVICRMNSRLLRVPGIMDRESRRISDSAVPVT